MRLGYIVLAHEPYEKIASLLHSLSSCEDDIIVLHYDLAQPHNQDITKIKTTFPKILLAPRIKVAWGEASIILATLNAMQVLSDHPVKADHVTLVSGSCFPVVSRNTLVKRLAKKPGQLYIECHDIKQSQWVIDGPEAERWELYHYLNWRKNPRFFSLAVKIQKALNIKRRFPFGNKIYMGSQWWTLTMDMIEKILEVTAQKKLMKFIQTTWIPDEFFFQTLVGNLVEDTTRIAPLLTGFDFNHQGVPKIYTRHESNEINHLRTKFCFLRKIKHEDTDLVRGLANIYCGKAHTLPEVPWENPGVPSWYKPNCFEFDMSTAPMPVVVVLDNGVSPERRNQFLCAVKKCLPGLKFYGDLFNPDKIDYGWEACLPLYHTDDIILRDYNWNEFIGNIAVHSPDGFLFYYGQQDLDRLMACFKSSLNTLFVDLADDGVDHLTCVKNHVASNQNPDYQMS